MTANCRRWGRPLVVSCLVAASTVGRVDGICWVKRRKSLRRSPDCEALWQHCVTVDSQPGERWDRPWPTRCDRWHRANPDEEIHHGPVSRCDPCDGHHCASDPGLRQQGVEANGELSSVAILITPPKDKTRPEDLPSGLAFS